VLSCHRAGLRPATTPKKEERALLILLVGFDLGKSVGSDDIVLII
jgi:hypothetical protein